MYCNEDHPADVKFSPEHIIPVSLGGVGAFTIQVCERINNAVGNRIDDPFISMFSVNSDRFFNDLKSHRGMPTLDLSGTSVIDGKTTQVESTVKDGTKTLRISKPIVETKEEVDRVVKNIFGDPQQVRKMLHGMLDAATEKGKTMTFTDGALATHEEIDRRVAEGAIETKNPSVLLTLNLNGGDAVRFLAKIALATGYLIGKEAFGRSAIATQLRPLMNAIDITTIPMPGAFWPFMPKNAAFNYFTVNDSHIIAMLPNEPNVLAISLFDGSYTALVPLIEEGSQLLLPPHQGAVLQILFKERRMKRWEYGDYLQARPWQAPPQPQ